MFDEHTVPKHNFEGLRLADGGGMPGGVEGRCRPTILMYNRSGGYIITEAFF